jgi:RNA polymerase primary sigma factor
VTVRGQLSERELVLAAKESRGEARDSLLEAFTPLIGSVARGYRGASGVGRAELMQQGVVGLLRALERYDPELETPFWAYASWWVRQAMQQLVSELSRPFVVPDRAARQLACVRNTRRVYVQVNGREPSCGELARETGIERARVESLIAVERVPCSLEEPSSGDEGVRGDTFGERLPDPASEDAYERVAGRLALMSLLPRIATLSRREQTILRGRYGLDGPVQTLRGLGADLAISAERVRPARATGARDAAHRRHAGPDLGLVRPPAGLRCGRGGAHGSSMSP